MVSKIDIKAQVVYWRSVYDSEDIMHSLTGNKIFIHRQNLLI